MRRVFLVLGLLVLLCWAANAQRFPKRGRNDRKNRKHRKNKGKKMMQDPCTAAGHPCMLGQQCVVPEYTGEERCVCIDHCPDVPNAEVCGSDMKTYPTACHLYRIACETGRFISAVAFGRCDLYHTDHLKVEPEMAKTCANSVTTFRCIIDSMVEEVVEWRKDGKTIENGKKYFLRDTLLTITYVEEMDAGNYTCVTNVNGTLREANATLKYIREPSVSIPDNHIQCESGDQVMIPCNHSSDSTVTWMKNGYEIDENDMSMDKSGMLIMKNTNVGAAGEYSCVASNFCGVSKASCTLNVVKKDPTKCAVGETEVQCFRDPCQGMTCESRPELTCTVTRCEKCDYFWVDETNSVVECPPLQAPKILNKAEVSLTSEGEDAIIECDVEGYPKPNVAWVKEDGTSVVGLKRHNVREGNILVVRQVLLGRDNGKYRCIAENKVGRVETSIVLAVMPRMSPMCPNTADKIKRCETDFCATAKCPVYQNDPDITCVNTVCNVCSFVFKDKKGNLVDCYTDPDVVKKMMNMQKMSMGKGSNMGSMAGWPAGSNMGSMAGWPAGSNMGSMAGWPAGSNMGSMVGWPAGSNMGSMAGWPAGSNMGSMAGWPAGSNMGSMAGWPAGSMGGHGKTTAMPSSGKKNGSKMSSKNTKKMPKMMNAMPGWPAGPMKNMPGWPQGSNMGSMPAMPLGTNMGSMSAWPSNVISGSKANKGSMAGWPANSNMGSMAGWPANSNMGSMAGWPANSNMGSMSSSGMGMSSMDKNAWHFVPGWPGHMSQMKSGGKAQHSQQTAGNSAQGNTQGGHGGGHLNPFYSGRPTDDEEEGI